MYATVLLMALGSWGPSGCPPVGGPRFVPAPPPAYDHVYTFEWKGFADDPAQFALYRGGVQVGGWHQPTDTYRPYDRITGRWGAATKPPCPPPALAKAEAASRPRPCAGNCDCRCTRDGECVCFLTRTSCGPDCPCAGIVYTQGPPMPTGVDESKLSGTNRLTVGGKEVNPYAFFYGGGPPANDSKKPYISVVGDAAFLEGAKKEFAPGGRYHALTEDFLIGYFEPDDWQVKGVGILRPGVSIWGPRDNDGRASELHHKPTLDGLDKAAIRALRKPDPRYDPTKTPDLTLDPPPGPPTPRPGDPASWWRFAAIGAGLLFLVLRRGA